VKENIYVDVNISGYAVLGYDFLEKFCDAQWGNASQDLPCLERTATTKVLFLSKIRPKWKTAVPRRVKVLMTFPQAIKDGLITGKYPGFNVQTGDRFQAWINCMYKANDCNMIYKLQYQIGKGAVQTLGQWNEVYEGQHYVINIDLSALNGQKVKFILTVLANGSPHEDYALWIATANHQTERPTAHNNIYTNAYGNCYSHPAHLISIIRASQLLIALHTAT